MIDVLAI